MWHPRPESALSCPSFSKQTMDIRSYFWINQCTHIATRPALILIWGSQAPFLFGKDPIVPEILLQWMFPLQWRHLVVKKGNAQDNRAPTFLLLQLGRGLPPEKPWSARDTDVKLTRFNFPAPHPPFLTSRLLLLQYMNLSWLGQFRAITYVISSYSFHSLSGRQYNDSPRISHEDIKHQRGCEWLKLQSGEFGTQILVCWFQIPCSFFCWLASTDPSQRKQSLMLRILSLDVGGLRNSAPQIAHCGLLKCLKGQKGVWTDPQKKKTQQTL